MTEKYDTIVIGGGFYGLRIAQFLAEELKQKRILVVEKETDVMQRASYNNQARVHNGYHYPRSILTAIRSRVNLPVFVSEYRSAIVDDFDKYYAVARNFSKVSSRQFERFFERIGADLQVDQDAKKFFDDNLIEEVFKVKEFAFNTAQLKQLLLERLASLNVEVRMSESAGKLSVCGDGLRLVTDKAEYEAKYMINTTYSSINSINQASELPIVPLKHEMTEMCLVEVPSEFDDKAFTIMCGPFFSLMPFPDKGLYTLSHVRYTPHREWQDKQGSVVSGREYLSANNYISHFPLIYADAKRYMPLASKIKYSGESLWEVKTVLPQSEKDDSRPIMYLDNYGGMRNYICIMGGKIDNVYDVLRELQDSYEKA